MTEQLRWVAKGIEWGNGVLDGSVPACRYVKLAVERFVKDLKRTDWEFEFDPDQAELWLEFISNLRHVKGRRFAGNAFEPAGFQCFIVMNIYGWVHKETRFRRFTEAYIEKPRKNGKSFLAAGLALGHLCIDDEPGAEVYTGATSEKQAWEVFRPARQMLRREDMNWLLNVYGIEVNAKSITIPMDGSRFEPLIGNPGDGASPSFTVVDEFHEHKTNDLVETMTTGMAAREQSLLMQITTAGSDFGGPCREKHSDVVRILEGTEHDDSIFGIIFTIDEGDAWDSVESLQKANPNWEVMNQRFILGELAKARRSATKQNSFKTKHLNLWVGAKISWMNMLAFQRCQRKKLSIDKFKGCQAFLGIDLASRVDVASVAILIPDARGINAFFKHYLPEDAVYNDEKNTRYKGWSEGGWLTTTPGEVIDFDYIEEDLKELASFLEIIEAGYDPYQATQFATHMLEDGFPMVEVRPTVLNFSEPMKELEALILKRRFFYNDPMFTWMMGNVVAKIDKKDNIYPDKERVENKIDDVVATIMAMNRWMASREDSMPDDYELTVA
jgi:phage terminase large subunit-like protein